MKITDAAKLLNIGGSVTPESIKKAYKRAASKYHPDKGGSADMMKAVNEACETLKDYTGNIDQSESTYGDDLNDAINTAATMEGVDIEVCGAWVWLSGNTKPFKEALKAAGFKWASKKKSWYYRPDDWKSFSRGKYSMEDIREMHGSQSVQGKKANKIEKAA